MPSACSTRRIDRALPQGQTCCGQPAYTTGYTDEARKVARAQLGLFANDWPVVVPSGSCAGMLRHHYLSCSGRAGHAEEGPGAGRAHLRAGRVPAQRLQGRVQGCRHADQVALHTSCSAVANEHALHGRALLAQLGQVERVEHDHESECCGFGGTFSVRMPDISGAMVLDKTRALKESGAHQVVSADCGCLMNINGSLEKQREALRGQHGELPLATHRRCPMNAEQRSRDQIETPATRTSAPAPASR